MKRKIYFTGAVIGLLSLLSCNGGDQKAPGSDAAKTAGNDSGKGQITATENQEKREKHLVFLDSAAFAKLKEDDNLFSKVKANFETLPIDVFEQFKTDFNDMFKINTSASQIEHSLPLAFSIYDKFHNFQAERNLQSEETLDQASQRSFQNRIRIYPAIGADKIFYLIMMRESKDMPGQKLPLGVTDLSVYYSMRYNGSFNETDVQLKKIPTGFPPITTAEADADIRRFQTVFNGVIQANPKLTFRGEKSFFYSIKDYNQLLGNSLLYWNIASEQQNTTSNVRVLIFPGIDQRNTNDVRFRLMFKLYRLNASNKFEEIAGKEVFDNMDPCPTVCPSNEIN